MIEPVKSVASSPSTADGRGSDQPAPDSSPPPPPKPAVQDEPLRLVVEPTTGDGGYTYKLFDRVTGQLLIELPRETAASLSSDPAYSAGQLFNAKA
jgi:flagellar protein FlaG